jgi:hypothetical protein
LEELHENVHSSLQAGNEGKKVKVKHGKKREKKKGEG